MISTILLIFNVWHFCNCEDLPFFRKLDIHADLGPTGIAEIPDGFVLVGIQYGEVAVGQFIRLDEYGNVVTSKKMEAVNYSFFNNIYVDVVDDEYLYILGYDLVGTDSGALFKTDFDGTVISSWKFPSATFEDPWAIKATSDGGFILAGRDWSGNGIVYKLDSDLGVDWSFLLTHDVVDTRLIDISPIDGGVGGYVAVGTLTNEPEIMIQVIIGSTGTLTLVKTWDNTCNDAGYGVVATAVHAFDDGTYVVSGNCDTIWDWSMGMMDASGALMWGKRVYGTSGFRMVVDSDDNICGIGFNNFIDGGYAGRVTCIKNGAYIDSVEFSESVNWFQMAMSEVSTGGFIAAYTTIEGFTVVEKLDLPTSPGCNDTFFTPEDDADIVDDGFIMTSEFTATLRTDQLASDATFTQTVATTVEDTYNTNCWVCPDGYDECNDGDAVEENCSCDCSGTGFSGDHCENDDSEDDTDEDDEEDEDEDEDDDLDGDSSFIASFWTNWVLF